MPSSPHGCKVLVTGANGYIAVWVVKDLLEGGYAVRGTVRDESKASPLHTHFREYGSRFETVVVADMIKDGAFDEAVKDVEAIVHTASPATFDVDDPDDYTKPAVRGTIGILESAQKNAHILKRIVVLSSAGAVASFANTGVIDESCWNEKPLKEVNEKGREASQLAKYQASKYLAEKAAWDFMETQKDAIGWDLITLCPPFVFGPILTECTSPEKLNVSMKVFYDAVFDGGPQPDDFQASWVDVRDVSRAHVLALQKTAAGGKRFVLSSGEFIWQDWYDAVNSLSAPGIQAPLGSPGAGESEVRRKTYNAESARTVLGLAFGDKQRTAKDVVRNFAEKQLLPRKRSEYLTELVSCKEIGSAFHVH